MKQAYQDLYEAQTIKRGNYKLKNINKVSEDKIEPILTAKVDGYNTTLCRTAYGRDSFELSTYKNGQLKERLTSTGEGIIDKYYRPDMNLAEGDYRIMNKNDKELKKAEKFIQKFLSVFVK